MLEHPHAPRLPPASPRRGDPAGPSRVTRRANPIGAGLGQARGCHHDPTLVNRAWATRVRPVDGQLGLHQPCGPTPSYDAVRARRGEDARGKDSARTRPHTPLLNRNVAKVHHHCIPPPLTSSQVSVWTSPASTVAWTRTSNRIPCERRRRPTAIRVCAGHRPAAGGRDDRLIHGGLDTPTGYMKRPPDRRFRRSRGPFSTWW